MVGEARGVGHWLSREDAVLTVMLFVMLESRGNDIFLRSSWVESVFVWRARDVAFFKKLETDELLFVDVTVE